jgi:hypothetical protein
VLRSKGARRTETSGNESVGILCAPAAGHRLSPGGIAAIKGGDDAIFHNPERGADALKESTIVTYNKECALTIKKESLQRFTRINIEVVGWLVEQQKVCRH